jgi:metal-dependent HD superfamily phosphatase/phosphodiesterase
MLPGEEIVEPHRFEEVQEATGFEAAPMPAEPAVLPLHEINIRLPARHNETLRRITERVNADEELWGLWRAVNVNAVARLGMSDHGPVHVQIVANIALKLLRMLAEHGVEPSIVRDHGLTRAEAEVVVVLASLLHDLGMSIHRLDHEQYSLFLANGKLHDLLAGLYPPAIQVIVTSEVLHAIIAHRAGGHPLTLEAGVTRVADALDMAKGRTRIPFEAGKINIHSLSATAIDRVLIERGQDKPIRIRVEMSNSAGIFQLDELLKDKLHGSGLEPYVEVEATIAGESERKLLQVFRL